MKIELYMMISCALLSVGSSVMLQAMQEQQEATEQSILTSPAARNKFYYNLIVERIQERDIKGALDILDKGLKRGFDINYRDDSGSTLLIASAPFSTIDLIQAFLRAGADPNIKNNRGRAPLHLTILSKDAPLVIRELVRAGAPVNVKSNEGSTPLMLAVNNARIPAIQTLLNIPGIDIMAKNENGETAFDIAKEKGNPEVIKLLTPYYTTLKGLSLDYIRKHRDQFTDEQIKKLPLELQEELLKQ